MTVSSKDFAFFGHLAVRKDSISEFYSLPIKPGSENSGPYEFVIKTTAGSRWSVSGSEKECVECFNKFLKQFEAPFDTTDKPVAINNANTKKGIIWEGSLGEDY